MNKALRYVGITFGIGILLGIVTSFGQTYLPAPFTQLANSYSIWLLFSFIVGYILKSYKMTTVASAGILVQYLAILFYYVASAIRFDMSLTVGNLLSANMIWIIGGTLAGPIASLAGLAVARKSKHLPASVGFVGSLFLSEALYQFILLGYVAEGVVFSLVGFAFLLLSYYKVKYPLAKTLLSTAALTVLMFIGYAYLFPFVYLSFS